MADGKDLFSAAKDLSEKKPFVTKWMSSEEKKVITENGVAGKQDEDKWGGWMDKGVEKAKGLGENFFHKHGHETEIALIREVKKRFMLISLLGGSVYSSLWFAQDFCKDFFLLMLPYMNQITNAVENENESEREKEKENNDNSGGDSGSGSGSGWKSFIIEPMLHPWKSFINSTLFIRRSGDTICASFPITTVTILLSLQLPARALLLLAYGKKINDRQSVSEFIKCINPFPSLCLFSGIWCCQKAAMLDREWRKDVLRQKSLSMSMNMNMNTSSQRDGDVGEGASLGTVLMEDKDIPIGVGVGVGVVSELLKALRENPLCRPHKEIFCYSTAALGLWIRGSSWFLMDLLYSSEYGSSGTIQSLIRSKFQHTITEKATATAVSTVSTTWLGLIYHWGPHGSFSLGLICYLVSTYRSFWHWPRMNMNMNMNMKVNGPSKKKENLKICEK
jgi:hypothetical protein